MLPNEFVRRELEREWEAVARDEKKLEEEKCKVVAEWVAVEDAQKEFNKKRAAFESAVRERFVFLPADDVVAFNVGGQLFKSTVRVWTRDRFSILAQLCTTSPKLPKLCPEDDAYFFDRDFWVFRFIYAFLRDNTLPESVDVLRELYCEASYYRIGLLRHTIEAKMIGEGAMAAGIQKARTLKPSATSSTNATPAASAASAAMSSRLSLPSTLSVKADISSRPSERASEFQSSPTKQQSASTSSTGSSSTASSLESKYSELPDPFGFTSKKKQAS